MYTSTSVFRISYSISLSVFGNVLIPHCSLWLPTSSCYQLPKMQMLNKNIPIQVKSFIVSCCRTFIYLQFCHQFQIISLHLCISSSYLLQYSFSLLVCPLTSINWYKKLCYSVFSCCFSSDVFVSYNQILLTDADEPFSLSNLLLHNFIIMNE